MVHCGGLGNGSCGCGDGEEGGAGDMMTTGLVTSVAPASTVSVTDGKEGRRDVASDGLWAEAVSVSRVGVGVGNFKKSVYPRHRENSSLAVEL